jgi:hypothetical protein
MIFAPIFTSRSRNVVIDPVAFLILRCFSRSYRHPARNKTAAHHASECEARPKKRRGPRSCAEGLPTGSVAGPKTLVPRPPVPRWRVAHKSKAFCQHVFLLRRQARLGATWGYLRLIFGNARRGHDGGHDAASQQTVCAATHPIRGTIMTTISVRTACMVTALACLIGMASAFAIDRSSPTDFTQSVTNEIQSAAAAACPNWRP